jgi:ACR3 family arsenite transporter
MEIQTEKMPVQKEKQEESNSTLQKKRNFSAFASLGLLDRIILGNFVPSMSPALEKGTFVGVSIPIGKSLQFDLFNDLFDNNI